MPDERQPAGIAFALRDPWRWPAFSGLARLGEALAYGAVFLPEIDGRDTFAALTGLAAETDRLGLATGVVPMTSRRTRTTAMGAATVHERSGGRAILGLGTGPARPGALDALRGQVGELRALLAGEPVEGVEPLSLALPSPVPIWIAALGPRAVALAGELADGVLLNWCDPGRVARARQAIEEAAETAGRDPGSVSIGVYVRASLGEDPAAEMGALRTMTGEYASYPAYARQFAAMGLAEEVAVAAAAHRAGVSDDVPEALVRAVALVGEPAASRARLDAYTEAGADLTVVYPVAAGADGAVSVASTLEALAPGR